MVMTKSVFICFQLFLVVTAVLAESSTGLIYIGNFNENDYLISISSASWSSADNVCRHMIGGGHLVAVETEAEWNFLANLLENGVFGITYWTSGMYDPSRSLWNWTKNSQEIGAFAPWGPGFPRTPDQNLRVTVSFNEWITVPGTQLHRYICEVQLH